MPKITNNILTKNENFCPLWNKGLYIEKINQTDAHISSCCFQTLSPDTYSTIDFVNNDYLSQFRDSTADFKNFNECFWCKLNENIGNQSYRQGQISSLKLQNIEINDSVELISLLYNCENACNLKCITCGPKFSSMWRAEYKKLGYRVDMEKNPGIKNTIYKSLDLSKLQFLHFQGGEPLLTDDHVNILKQVEEQGDIGNLIVSYNTNGTIFPDSATINSWKKTKMAKIFFSIDATDQAFEYIRFPASWKQVENNMFAIRDLEIENLWIELGITVGIANIFYLQEIIDWRDQYFSKDKFNNNINIYINFVGDLGVGGTVLNLNKISDYIKSEAIEYLTALTDTSISSAIISNLRNIDTTKNTDNIWIEYLEKIDTVRNNNWKESLLKLYEITKRNRYTV